YFVFGTFTAVIVTIFFIQQEDALSSETRPSDSAIFTLILTLLGVMLVSFAYAWMMVLRQRRTQIPPGATGLVQGWTRFENALRAYAAREFGESRSTMPWYEIFDLVESKRVFSPEELNQLGAIVEMRNNIVHSTQQYKEAEIDAARKTLTDALKRVE